MEVVARLRADYLASQQQLQQKGQPALLELTPGGGGGGRDGQQDRKVPLPAASWSGSSGTCSYEASSASCDHLHAAGALQPTPRWPTPRLLHFAEDHSQGFLQQLPTHVTGVHLPSIRRRTASGQQQGQSSSKLPQQQQQQQQQQHKGRQQLHDKAQQQGSSRKRSSSSSSSRHDGTLPGLQHAGAMQAGTQLKAMRRAGPGGPRSRGPMMMMPHVHDATPDVLLPDISSCRARPTSVAMGRASRGLMPDRLPAAPGAPQQSPAAAAMGPPAATRATSRGRQVSPGTQNTGKQVGALRSVSGVAGPGAVPVASPPAASFASLYYQDKPAQDKKSDDPKKSDTLEAHMDDHSDASTLDMEPVDVSCWGNNARWLQALAQHIPADQRAAGHPSHVPDGPMHRFLHGDAHGGPASPMHSAHQRSSSPSQSDAGWAAVSGGMRGRLNQMWSDAAGSPPPKARAMTGAAVSPGGDDVLVRAERLVRPRAPCAPFMTAPRWPSAGGRRTRARTSSPVQGGDAPSEGDAQGQTSAPSRPRTAAPVSLDKGYAAVMPRRPAAWFSMVPRFPADTPQEQEQGADQETWQDSKPYRPSWSAPKTRPSTTPDDRPSHSKVVTAGVEAACDFVKGHHVPGVLCNPPSVRQEMVALLAARRRTRVEQQREQQQQQQQLAAEQAGALQGTAGATAEGAQQATAQRPPARAVLPAVIQAPASQPMPSQTALVLAASAGTTVAEDTADAAMPAGAAEMQVTVEEKAEQLLSVPVPATSPDRLRRDVRAVMQHAFHRTASIVLEQQQRHQREQQQQREEEAERALLMQSLQLDAARLPPYAQPLRRSLSVQPTAHPPLEPQWSAIERAARAVGITPPRARASSASRLSPPRGVAAGQRYSRDPGPGAHMRVDAGAMAVALSTAPRAPHTVFGSAPRHPSPPQAESLALAVAAAARRARDPLAALDRVLRRAPAPVILKADRDLSNPSGSPPHDPTGGDDSQGSPHPLHISYGLVERRPRASIILPPWAHGSHGATDQDQPLTKEAEEQLALELSRDPWGLDVAVRLRKPAWPIPSIGREEQVMGPQLPPLRPLYPNWQLLRPRTSTGIPLFAHYLNTHRMPDPAGDRRRGALTPAVGQYDLQEAWVFIQKHVPQVVMRLVQARWRVNVEEALAVGGDQAVLELSTAMLLLRPRAPAWTIAPLPSHHSVLGARFRGMGYGPMLSWDVEAALENVLHRKSQGVLDWRLNLGRHDTLEETALRDTRHLGPTSYDIRFGLVENRVVAHRFRQSPEPHSNSSSTDGGSVTELDVAGALDATRRRPRHMVHMGVMLDREEVIVGTGDVFGHLTSQLSPVHDPDVDLLLSHRPRVRQVVMGGWESVESIAPEDARRGPGAYHVKQGAVGMQGPWFDFSRAEGHKLDTPEVSPMAVREGRRLVLSPNWDAVRPRAPVAVIAGLQQHHARHVPGQPAPDLYHHATYDTTNMDLVYPVPARPTAWALQSPGRFPDPGASEGNTRLLDYRVEDVPLHVLAGHASVVKVLDWSRTAPSRDPRDDESSRDLEGDRLDLDHQGAYEVTRRRPVGMPGFHQAPGGHEEAAWLRAGDPELTAWLDYNPRLDPVRPQFPRAPNLSQVGRGSGPQEPQGAAGDLDGGVYNVRHNQVWASPQAGPSWQAGAGLARLPEDSHDPDCGNQLYLDPQEPQGWHPARQASPSKQPFGLTAERWSAEQPRTSADGPNMYLATHQDDMATLRKRPTLPNAPATAFGHMTSHRYDGALRPDENKPWPVSQEPPQAQRMETTLLHELPANKGLELMQRDPQNPLIVAALRRERVWERLERRIALEHPARLEDLDQAARQAAADRAAPQPGVVPHLAPKPSAVGRKEWAVKQRLVPRAPRDKALAGRLQAEERADQEAEAAARRSPPRERHVNKMGMFFVANDPNLPPAVPPPTHANNGGFFHQVRGAPGQEEVLAPRAVAMQQQQPEAGREAARRQALRLKLPGPAGGGGSPVARNATWGVVYESDPSGPTMRQQQALATLRLMAGPAAAGGGVRQGPVTSPEGRRWLERLSPVKASGGMAGRNRRRMGAAPAAQTSMPDLPY